RAVPPSRRTAPAGDAHGVARRVERIGHADKVPSHLTGHQIRNAMGISHAVDGDGIAEVVMDNPPVNALTVAGWFELADIVRGLGDDPRVRVVILRAEGKGFNAGVDIK